MNEVLRVISERYTCRSYTGDAVEREKLEAIASAGIQAPSAINSQRWRIVVVTDKKLIEELDDAALELMRNSNDVAAYERIMSRGGKPFYNAPVMFLVLTNSNGRFSPELDCGIVVENMALAATSLGLGNCVNLMCGTTIVALDENTRTAFKERVNWPEGYEFAVGLLVGYPANEPNPPHEPDPGKIIWA